MGRITVAAGVSWLSGVVGTAERFCVVVVVAGAVVAVVADVPALAVVVVAAAVVVVVAWASITSPFWTDVDVDAAGFAVVVVAPAAVVVVVFDDDSGGRGLPRTGRNRSSAVWPTMSSAFCRSFTPGRSTMMLLPCRLTSGSATPSESTRLRMMFTACPSVSDLTLVPAFGASTTEIPPWRSSPSCGVVCELSTAAIGTRTRAMANVNCRA